MLINNVLKSGAVTEETSKALTNNALTINLKEVLLNIVSVPEDFIANVGKCIFDVLTGTIVLFATFCFFTSIFGTQKMLKYIPLTMGLYILLMAVKICL